MEHGGAGSDALGIGVGVEELNILFRETDADFHTSMLPVVVLQADTFVVALTAGVRGQAMEKPRLWVEAWNVRSDLPESLVIWIGLPSIGQGGTDCGQPVGPPCRVGPEILNEQHEVALVALQIEVLKGHVERGSVRLVECQRLGQAFGWSYNQNLWMHRLTGGATYLPL